MPGGEINHHRKVTALKEWPQQSIPGLVHIRFGLVVVPRHFPVVANAARHLVERPWLVERARGIQMPGQRMDRNAELLANLAT